MLGRPLQGPLERCACGARHRLHLSISHAYDDEFLGVVDSIASLEARNFYYFDLLVVNQHTDAAVGCNASTCGGGPRPAKARVVHATHVFPPRGGHLRAAQARVLFFLRCTCSCIFATALGAISPTAPNRLALAVAAFSGAVSILLNSIAC